VRTVALAAIALAGLSQAVCAQTADDSVARFKSCLQLESTARQECLEKLSRELSSESTPVSPAVVPANGGNWVVSETTSPVDYSPQITAAIAAEAIVKDAPSSFSIRCRGQRTELLVSTTGAWRPSSGGELKVAYRINDQPATEERWTAIAGGRSAVIQGSDVIQFLRSLPGQGRISFRVYDWQGPPHDATFQFSGLEDVRRKIAEACKWPEGEARRR
jgi:hypothetical protein